MRVIKVALGMLGCLSVVSCSSLTGNSQPEYMKDSQQLSSLTIPKGVPAPTQSDEFALPTVSSSEVKPVSLIPPGSKIDEYRNSKNNKKSDQSKTASSITSSAVVDKTGQQLLVAVTPAQLYQPLSAAIQSAGYPIVTTNKTTYRYIIADVRETGNHLTSQTPRYQLQLKQDKTGSVVTVLDGSGKILSSLAARTLLLDIANHLA